MRFDREYYRRFYFDPRTAVTSRAEMRARAKLFAAYADHAGLPVRRLLDAGCRVTLNSDDPAFFATSIGNEYAMASSQMGLSASELLAITRTAIDAAFVDIDTKRALLARIDRGA